MKAMNWSEPKPPIQWISNYNHVKCETPLGEFIIEWKSWKERPDYGVNLKDQYNDQYIGTGYSLEEAKEIAENHLNKMHVELTEFLKVDLKLIEWLMRENYIHSEVLSANNILNRWIESQNPK